MRLGVLFSGGKDSAYAAYLAKQHGHELSCLITIESENPDSFMFHTPSITKVERQAAMMKLPLVVCRTKGKKEYELRALSAAILRAKEEHGIEGVITGAVGSVYQSTRIQKICHELDLHVFNPLWQKDQIRLLDELLAAKFSVIIVAVAGEPLDASWLLRPVDKRFIADVTSLQKKHGINPAGEGGEFESFVLDCPLFAKPLKVHSSSTSSDGGSHRAEVELE